MTESCPASPRLPVVFMGTPDFAVASLEAVSTRHEVVCVYSQPPRPAGRGHKEQPSQVHRSADALNIPVRTPTSLKPPDTQQAFAARNADIAVVAASGLILPAPLLEAPRLGCINVHASLLPRWRGAAPIHRAVMAGDPLTGITIMRMDAGLDTGPILMQEAVPISPLTTSGALHDVLAALGARLVLTAIDGLAAGLTTVPQPADGVTYATKLAKDEGRLDWNQPAATLANLVRGLSPWPGAWFEHDGTRVKVLEAVLLPGGTFPNAGLPGTILDERLTVACCDGALRLLVVQRPGKGPVAAEAFLRGYALSRDTKLRVTGQTTQKSENINEC
ncbi:MAG: methionyl-tRNA formyltransferase [Alphaproteobacteria bacterium]|nr:methionyl-tRNA formyltransferase [Alphaproteobacteria bacterium]